MIIFISFSSDGWVVFHCLCLGTTSLLFSNLSFFHFWLCWVFIAARAFLWLWQLGAALQLWCAGFSCRGSSCYRAWALWASGLWAPKLQLLGSGAQSQRLWWISFVAPWRVRSSWSGTEPMSPALPARVFTPSHQGSPVPHLSYPFLCWWLFGLLLPCLGYCK